MSDHDSVGTLTTFTAITPVKPGSEGALRARLQGWPTGEESPLARVPGTHLARLFVIDALPYVALERNHLLFGAAFDGPREPYLAALHAALGDEVEAVWGSCAGFPTGAGAESFADWMLAHRIPARAVLAAFPHATVDRVRTALDLRHRVGLFAVANQRRAPHEVKQAFEEAFGAG